MITDFDKIVKEWSYRVHNSKPNPQNSTHQYQLTEILIEYGWPYQAIDELIQNLNEIDIVKNKKSGNVYPVRTHNPDTQDLIKKDASKDDIEKVKKDKEQDKEPESKEELLKSDHETTDDALRYTKSQAKKDGKRKGVGLGTDTSRAGEAAVHTGIRMFKAGASFEEIEKELMKIANEDDTFLNPKWVKSAMATLKAIDKKIGLKKIEDVAWDTDEGRRAIGVDPKLKTSSDMFVRTTEGVNIGISLKQDGRVFLNNGGWDEQSAILLDNLKEVMPPDEHKKISEAMSIAEYNKDRAERFKQAYKKYSPEDILEMVNSLTPEEIKKEKLSEKYLDILRNPEKLLEKVRLASTEKPNNLSGDEMKALHRLMKLKDKKGDALIRESDNVLSKKTFAVLNSSEEAKKGMNRHVLRAMHVFDALGLNQTLSDGGVDSFVTMYGIPPDGSTLDEENLVSLFGSKFQQVLADVRNGDADPEDLEELLADQIEIDYESGEILFRHEDGGRYPLFYLNGRARGIGTAPVMELGQTSFMALALKIGSFDTSTWEDKDVKKLEKLLKRDREE
tara:strand:+ start:81 stop:1766 length:1686 start_codon:yes stop_codon:yes gene_type:complete